MQEESDRNHRIILRQIQHQIDNILIALDMLSLQLASDPAIVRSMERGISMDDLETLEATLDMLAGVRRYRSYNEAVAHISLIYDHYDKVYSSEYGVLPKQAFPFPALLRKPLSDLTGTDLVPPGTYEGQTEYVIMRAVTSNTRVQPLGRVILHIHPSPFYEVFQSADLGRNRHLLVIDPDGRITISTNREEIGTRLSPASDLYHSWKEPDVPIRQLNGEDYYVSAQQSSFNQWTYMAAIPLKETTARADQIQWMTALTVCCILILWILIAFLGSKKLYRPIQSLFSRLSGNLQGEEDLKALGEYIERMVHLTHHLKDRWQEQLPLLKNHALLKLLRGEVNEWESAAFLSQYSIELKGSCFFITVFEVDPFAAFRSKIPNQQQMLNAYAFSRWVEEISKDIPNCESVIPAAGQAVLMISTQAENREMKKQVIQISDMVRCKASEHFHLSITAAVSDGVQQITQLPLAYEQALQLLCKRPLLGHGLTLTSETICRKPAVNEYAQIFLSRQKAMAASIADLNIALAAEHFEQMMDELSSYFVTTESMLSMFVCLLGEIEEVLRGKGFKLSEEMYVQLFSARDVSEAAEWFLNGLFPHLSQWVNQREQDHAVQQHLFIEHVTEYIHAHFDQDISLQQIAEHFDCSPYQLSRLFKEYKNMTFVEYVIRYRMEKAKEWLVHTDLSIKEISSRLRYASTQNFTRVFKQITGMPPGNYRNLHRSFEKV